MNPTIKIEGLNTLSARLARLAGAPGLQEALQQSAELVRDEAAERAIAGGRSHRSASALAASLDIIPEASGDQSRLVIGSRLLESRHAEFGTRRRRPAPFLLAALHSVSASVRQRIRDAVAKSTALGRKGR